MINEKAMSGFFIMNIVVAIFAFVVLMGGIVRAQETDPYCLFNGQKYYYEYPKSTCEGIGGKWVVVDDLGNVLDSFGSAGSLLTSVKQIKPPSSAQTPVGSTSASTNPPAPSFWKGPKGRAVIGGGAAIGAGFALRSAFPDSPLATAAGNALSASGAAYSVGGLLGLTGGALFGASLGVGAIVFILTYKKVEYETVFFTCQPWEAPIGGNDCELCNDGIHPCSEYRCKSLGQACELVNPGTEKELCVWQNPRDVNSPAIQPLEDALTPNFKYVPIGIRPPNWGTEIKPINSDCIPAFTPIKFGIETDKPAQCKIDFLIRGGGGDVDTEPLGYDEMEFFFGNNNLYDYNHTQLLSLPSPNTVNRIGELNVNEGEELEIRNDGRYSMYVRCRSANGFYNADPYAIEFCVEEGPDLTPPLIEETSIRNGEPVSYEIGKVPLSIFTNEPSNCKWSRDTPLQYQDMTNDFVCDNDLQDIRENMLYECRTELSGIKDREINQFYFRCEDQPWEEVANHNRMQEAYSFKLVGTEPLNIKEGSVLPKDGEVISGSADPVSFQLGVETQNGYQEGASSCLYSPDNKTYIKFFETGTHLHRQNQELSNGQYTYYYQCIDQGGNQAQTKTTFSVFVDQQAPRIVRILKEGNALKIATDENAICRYSSDENVRCNFEVNEDEGTPFQYASSDNQREHLTDWRVDETYYIKCMDEGKKEPSNIDCSVIVQPVELGEE